MRALLDVNVVIALLDASHVAHSKAHAWWIANKSAGWASCAISENGAIRVMSNRAYPSQARFTASEVIEALKMFVSNTDHQFWKQDVSFRDEDIFDRQLILSARQLTDLYLLALAAQQGGTLVTLDRNIPAGAVRIAKPQNLTIL